ncbi:cobalamin biosynthesis protein [Pseudomonas nicosulfuronedens]|uniref:Cobalamin biosynthesis protein n=1 Tax=Pseudomonas nicosulfuronedens TaxID=2571105 RepID=A0A5R9RB63_9PSED|nr:cobalamin biosynthesis protein [Pseudomonas nicosulfuronedens]MDH1008156.1 cobalamin biosynthesis protein [Pseudomonas nicosulfuronedens]MDH1981952.1 cobalamin biosynthesis protein [Pseudomonas nicosulfuronedens]MDH2030186.1 cobalamin biosynthesis protein [Pseudomonas nicosulfuronedens]TLX80504.1 cobalamin biosynthesis protein [Pseudomonas nicosulfuronedens]
MTLVAGLGCRRGCSLDELRELLRATLAESGLDESHLTALASATLKADEEGLLALAAALDLPLGLFTPQQLAACEKRLSDPSETVRAATGSASVAEAAALLQAEAQGSAPARLLVGKRRSDQATCALAFIPVESAQELS